MPIILAFLVLLSSASFSWSDDSTTTQPATFIAGYSGGYPDDYPQELNRVQSYVLSAQSAIATQLGLQYGQGFLHPVTIRFEDGVPAASENPYFYVRTKGSGATFSQELVVNVEAYAKRRTDLSQDDGDLRNGARYALTQAMLNDLTAGDPDSTMPLWVQEGLAVYASGAGDAMVQSVASKTVKKKAMDLLIDLNTPEPFLTPRSWAGYYLAIKYIDAHGGVSVLQTFVRSLTNGTSAPVSVHNILGQQWPAFVGNVREFSYETFKELAPKAQADLAS